MKKFLFLLVVAIVLNNCGGLELVLKNKNILIAKNNTDIHVAGDDATLLYLSLVDVIGDSNNSGKYKLLANSTNEDSAKIITKDATASKFDIKYTINYTMYDLEKSCKILNKTIVTINSYNAKAAGYSFGTDLSENETRKQNVAANIDKFLSALLKLIEIDKCNENN